MASSSRSYLKPNIPELPVLTHYESAMLPLSTMLPSYLPPTSCVSTPAHFARTQMARHLCISASLSIVRARRPANPSSSLLWRRRRWRHWLDWISTPSRFALPKLGPTALSEVGFKIRQRGMCVYDQTAGDTRREARRVVAHHARNQILRLER